MPSRNSMLWFHFELGNTQVVRVVSKNCEHCSRFIIRLLKIMLYYLTLGLFRLILPILLLTAAIIRPSLFSFVYGVLLLIWPFVPNLTSTGASSLTKFYLFMCVALSGLAALGQTLFHALFGNEEMAPCLDEHAFVNGSADIWKTLGLQRVNATDTVASFRLIGPDFITLFGSMITMMCAMKVSDTAPATTVVSSSPEVSKRTSAGISYFVVFALRLSDLVVALLLSLVAAIWPCLFSAVYFASLLVLCTWWAGHWPLKRRVYNSIKIFLIVFSALHLILLYVFQLFVQVPFFRQELGLTNDTSVKNGTQFDYQFMIRLIGLTPILDETNCESYYAVKFVKSASWPVFLNPVFILLFYIYTAFQYKLTRDGITAGTFGARIRSYHRANVANRDDGSSVHEELLCMDGEDDHTEKQISADQSHEGASVHSKKKMSCATIFRLISHAFTPDIGQKQGKLTTSLISFAWRNVYAMTLVSMMAWAVTYHAWLSFIWLLTACAIWLLKDSRKWCLILSPFIVFYAELLLCIQFVYGMRSVLCDLARVKESWPDDDAPMKMSWRQIGFITPEGAACKPLLLKLVYCLPFWITMRMFFGKTRYGQNLESSPDDPTEYGTFHVTSTIPQSKKNDDLLVKYWIFLVGLVILLISVRMPVVAYGICYMAFFIVLIAVLQISFRVWRFMLYGYLLILTTFSIIVLLLVYTFQFHQVPTFWSQTIEFSNQTLTDLGLISYDSASLFIQLLTPISFLIVVCLQLKFFHAGFMRITNISSLLQPAAADKTAPDVAVKRTQSKFEKWRKISRRYVNSLTDIVWRLLEIHVDKIVALMLILLAVYEVSAVNLVFVVLVAFMLPWRNITNLCVLLGFFWASLIVLSKMLYQLSFAQYVVKERNCTNFTRYINSDRGFKPTSWFGLEKMNWVAHDLQYYVYVFLIVTFKAIIELRQRYQRVVLKKPSLAHSIVFSNVNRKSADDSLKRCFKFLINYCFYKFGLEITYTVVVINIAHRLDGVAFLHTIWLFVMLLFSRRYLARFWPLFVIFLVIMLPIQYASCVGLPPALCLSYPWSVDDDSNHTKTIKNLFVWMYLPDYDYKPDPSNLIGDFLVLLLASCQLHVFSIETSSTADRYQGGSNTAIDYKNETTTPPTAPSNPVPNFINANGTFLDGIKVFIFVYFHWITLLVVFIAGVGSISLFSLGYLIAAFFILWKGNDLYTQSMQKVKLRWYLLLYYNVFVMVAKVGLQAVGCIFLAEIHQTSGSQILIKLFTLSCQRADWIKPTVRDTGGNFKQLELKNPEAELAYDAVVFAFLIFQLRIFASWYFRHTILEFNAERILSYRGAMLINQLIGKEMREQIDKENRIYHNLITKTAKIRDKYLSRLVGKPIVDTLTYADAKRAGDYYMFEEESDLEQEEEFLELESPKESLAPEVAPETSLRGVGPIQLTHIALTHDLDMKTTVTAAEQLDVRKAMSPGAAKRKETELRKRKSEPADLDMDTPGPSSSSGTKKVATPEKGSPKSSRNAGDSGGSSMGAMLKCLQFLLISVPDQCAYWFNKWSRDYRYVAHVLGKEKQILKENLIRNHSMGTLVNVKKVRETIFTGEFGQRIHLVKSESEIDKVAKEVYDHWLQNNVFVRFFFSAFYLILSHTELLCYVMIILDQMANSSAISLPLPLLVFFWGTLCSPRPPQAFWVTVITYTMAMIVVKFICQFPYMPDASKIPDNSPFTPVRIIGVERKEYFAAWDVALLMVLFFHRYVLKTLGLWKLADDDLECVAKMAASERQEKNSKKAASSNEIEVEKKVQATMTPSISDIVTEGAENEICQADGTLARKNLGFFEKIQYFFQRLLKPKCRYIMDLYAMMFFCDFVCFMIVVFGYSSFGISTGEENVVTDLTSNKVPLVFIIMLIALMMLIIIDRGIYLRKSLAAKLIFQYFLVIAVHAWVFFALPAITEKSTLVNVPAKLWYFIKGIYFILSAWQIRNGYPSRIIGNLLTKRYNMLNYILYFGFYKVPFLMELRSLIDWLWTDTCMPLFDFLSVENIYSLFYRTKCMRKFEADFPVPKGIPKSKVVKYGMGCPILLFIITLIWLPLLLFALVNSIGVKAVPEEATLTISIEGYPELYTVQTAHFSMETLSQDEYNKLYTQNYAHDKDALSFVRQYAPKDILRARFRPASSKQWQISEPDLQNLYDNLNSDFPMSLVFELVFVRPIEGKSKSQRITWRTELRGSVRYNFTKSLDRTDKVTIPHVFPARVWIPAVGLIQPVKALLMADRKTYKAGPVTDLFTNLTLKLESKYWAVNDTTDAFEGIEIMAFVDKVFPSSFESLTSQGVLGVYLVLVYAASQLLRNLFFVGPLEMILTEVQNADRILQICLDIFLVREMKDYVLELDLWAKLVFLFRSPDILMRWTKVKRE